MKFIFRTLISVAASALLLLGSCTSPDKLQMLVGTFTAGNDSQGVYLYEFDQNDATFVLKDTEQADGPSFIIPSADRKFAYSVGDADEAWHGAYSFSLCDTAITMLNCKSSDGDTDGSAPCNIVFAGGNVYTSNYNGGSVSSFPVLEDGTLGDMNGQFAPVRGEGEGESHIHCAALSPDGLYLFVTDLGLDAIYRLKVGDRSNPIAETATAYRFDPKMHPGPRHLVFSGDGRFAYLISEVGDYLSVFAYKGGELEHVSTCLAYIGEGHGSGDIHISPDGRFLYTSHRLKEDGISIFKINQDDGTVTNVGYCHTGGHPRNFAITPNGKYLLCACRDSNRIEIYNIHQEDGTLSDTEKHIELPAPVCVQLYR